MIIKELTRPWIKSTSQGKVYTDNSFYLSKPWRTLRARKPQISPYCECDDCKGKLVEVKPLV